ncbi:MAG: AAA family ATPase [Thermodesulfobacteriota bacterium]|nr:MAG: AAA family ATPase [Thermodesulfobacteriota bacterium]
MLDNKKRVKIDTKDQMLKKKFEYIISSTGGFEILSEDDKQPADLLIFEVGTDTDHDFHVIQSLLQSEAVTDIFLTSKKSDQDLLLQSIRIGAKEFFPQPIKDDEVKKALKKFREGPQSSKRIKLGQLINIMGSKGGVGTTTIAVNLAVSLAEIAASKSVALVDMNMATGETPLFLDLRPGYHWGAISKNITRLDPTFIMNVLSKHSSGIYLFSSPGTPGHENVSPEAVERLLNIMRRMFDFVVIDSGQLLDLISQKIHQISDTVLLITILTLPCIANTKKIFKIYDFWGYPRKGKVKIVVNRYLKNSQVTLKDAEESFDHSIFWNLPNDFSTTFAAINQGKVLSAIEPKAEITKKFRRLAATFASKDQKPANKNSSFVKRWFS